MRFSQLLDIRSTDPDDARRRKLLNVLLVSVATLGLMGLLVTIGGDIVGLETQEGLSVLYLASGAVLGGAIAIFVLNRYGPGWLASTLLLLLLVAVPAVADEPDQVANGRSLLLFTLPIIMASVLLPPYASFIAAGLCSLAIATIALNAEIVPNPFAMILFFAVALVAWLSARSLERALCELRQTNLELDQRVQDRTRDLAETLAREQAELSKSQAILEGIADGVIVFDEQGKAIVANPAISRLIGLPQDRILGQNIQTLMHGRVDADDQPVVLHLLQARSADQPSLKLEWSDKVLAISSAPVTLPDGRQGTVAVFRDFTREAEVDRMKSDFVSIVSHELRTPLTAIKGYLDLLLLGAPGPVNRQQESFLRIAQDNTGRLHELVSDLLDLSRIESGRVELDIGVIMLPALVREVVEGLQHEFSDRGLALRVEVPTDLPHVFGDRRRLIQVLTNLLSNAYKYTPSGSVTMQAQVHSRYIQVNVSDTGIGISPEDQARLFSRFFRAEDSYVRQQAGTGLGLSITKPLVELHGGQLWVESQPGWGSTFSFTLPLPAGRISVPLPPPAAAPTREPLLLTGPHILVADDQPDIAQLLRHQLEQHGYRVTTIHKGGEVVAAARRFRPDLITLDILMEVDGFTILQQLKQDPATAAIPVVIVSVVPESKKGLALGAADYLVKPLDENALVSCVQRVLDALNGGGRRKILVVDDEPDIVGWLKHSLRHAGYQVTEAFDGLQALEAVARDRPDLILLDLRMPRMDGRTVIRRLRENPDTRNLPIIVLTASQVALDDQIYTLGVRQLLQKPIAIEAVIAEVQAHLPPPPSPHQA